MVNNYNRSTGNVSAGYVGISGRITHLGAKSSLSAAELGRSAISSVLPKAANVIKTPDFWPESPFATKYASVPALATRNGLGPPYIFGPVIFFGEGAVTKFKWLETFELGVPLIDDCHKKIMSAMQDVLSLAETGQIALCKERLDELLRISAEHFQEEENFLRECGYDSVENHVRYHARMYSRAEAVNKSCANIESKEDLKDCCEEMMAFLVDDVIKGDIALKTFFQNKGLAKPH